MTGSTELKSGAVYALLGRAGIYTVGNVLQRGIGFLLIPLLTLVLSAEDFGRVAIATSAGTVLALFLGFGLDSACSLVSYRYVDEADRRSLYTTLVAFSLVVSGIVTLILDRAGQAGLINWLPGLPFNPYLRMTLWTSFCSLLISLPQAIFTALGQPFKVVGLALSSSVLTAGLTTYLVLSRHQGVRGWFLGNLIAAIAMAALSLAVLMRLAGPRGSLSQLRIALRFSVPLIPHTAGNWLLNLSDRFILAGYVAVGTVGLYSLGSQLGMGVSIGTNAISNALFPLVYARLARSSAHADVPPLGTYALLLMTMLSLAVGLAGSDLIRLLTPQRFHGAGVFVPWMAWGALFQGVYLIWSRGTWYSMRTGWIPVLTGLAAAVNIGLNLLFVPRWGVMAAAVDTVAAYATLALLHGYLASKIYPIAWEYERWIKLLLVGTFCLVAGNTLAQGGPLLNLAVKSLVLLILFPGSLLLARFFTQNEIQLVRGRSARLFQEQKQIWRQSIGSFGRSRNNP